MQLRINDKCSIFSPDLMGIGLKMRGIRALVQLFEVQLDNGQHCVTKY